MQKTAKIVLWSGGILIAVVVLLLVGMMLNRRGYGMMATSAGVFSPGIQVDEELGVARSAIGSMMGGYAQEKNIANDVPAAMPVATANRMVIKTGDLSMVVKDVPATIKSIITYAESKGGFVVNSSQYKYGEAPYGVVSVRIPAKEFDGSVAEAKTLGEVKSETVNGQDVTEEYVDLDARKNNLKATEKQFLAILAKAQKITDILEVQRELSNVRGQIESMEGRMKYLRENVNMSSLTVNLSTDPSILPTIEKTNQWKPIVVIKSALRGLLAVGKSLVNVLIWLVVFVPLWALIVLIIWLVYRYFQKRKTDSINFKK